MTNHDAREALAILGRMLDAIEASVASRSGYEGASFRRALGSLRAEAEADIKGGALGTPLQALFDAARQAGASLSGMKAVEDAMLAETPAGLAAIAVVQAGLRMSLGQQAIIMAGTEFVSRSDVETMQVAMNAAFDPAETAAADEMDQANYRALIALHAAVTKHLSDTARPLPRIVNYSFPVRMPALVLAHRLYADASRAAELIAENKVVHPLFMPAAGRALAN